MGVKLDGSTGDPSPRAVSPEKSQDQNQQRDPEVRQIAWPLPDTLSALRFRYLKMHPLQKLLSS